MSSWDLITTKYLSATYRWWWMIPWAFANCQLDAWLGKISFSWAGKLIISLSWESARDDVWMKMLLLITIMSRVKETHPIIIFCHIWIYEITRSADGSTSVNGIGTFQREDSMCEDLMKLSSSAYRILKVSLQCKCGTLRGRSEKII